MRNLLRSTIATMSSRYTFCCIPTRANMSSSSTASAALGLPSSLASPPIKSIVEPGNCQFTDEFTKVPLIENTQVSETSFVARFGLPDTAKPLGLSTCACILAGVEVDGEMVVRPYTPISTNADVGTFDLLVKKYPDGKMSSFLSDLKPSEDKVVAFKHIPFNIKIQYPFGSPKTIVMLAGGTGITPMIQALHAILGDEEGAIEKTHLIYGSRTQSDILGKEMLDKWAAEHSDKLSITHVLSHEEGEIKAEDGFKKGFIDRAMIESIVPPPSDGKDVLIFVCGPPIMYDIFCGARTEEEVTGILGEIGYSSDQVFKF